MICPKCKGERVVYHRNFESIVMLVPCPVCNGTGEVAPIVQKFKKPHTNFQRITESPEALAEFMDELSNACITCGINGSEYHNENCPFGDFGNCADRGSMFLWLKQESKE